MIMDPQRGAQSLGRLAILAIVGLVSGSLAAMAGTSVNTGKSTHVLIRPKGGKAERRRPQNAITVAASALRRKAQGRTAAGKAADVTPAASTDEIASMKQQLSLQEHQIERLSTALTEQKQLLERALQSVK